MELSNRHAAAALRPPASATSKRQSAYSHGAYHNIVMTICFICLIQFRECSEDVGSSRGTKSITAT